MLKYNKDILNSIELNHLKNIHVSPVWLLKVEKIFHNGSYYLKIYVYKNLTDITINEIGFIFKYRHTEINIKSSNIIRANTYPNDPVYGCSIKMPDDFQDSDYSFRIITLVIDTKLIDYSAVQTGLLNFSSNLHNSKSYDYLKTNLKSFNTLPEFNDHYWKCHCGKYNPITQISCLNCDSNVESNHMMFNQGIDLSALKLYVEKNPLIFDNKVQFDDAFDKYIKNIENILGLSTAMILHNVNRSIEEEKYLNSQTSFNKEENLKKKRFRKTLSYIIFSAIAITLFTIFGLPFIKYSLALNQISSGNFSEGIKSLENLGEYRDSQDQLIEAKYLYLVNSLDKYESEPSTIKIEDLEITNTMMNTILAYKDVSSTQKFRLYYLYGEAYRKIQDYENSYDYYSKISIRYLESKDLVNEVLVKKYQSLYKQIDVSTYYAISELEEFINQVISDGNGFNKNTLIDTAKNDIIENAFIDHKYLNEFPSTDNYLIALKYLQQRGWSGDQDKIDMLNLAVSYNGEYSHCRYRFSDGDCSTATVYINMVKMELYYQYEYDDTWFTKELSYKTWNSFALLSIYNGSNEGSFYLSGNTYYLDWDGSFGVLTKQ